MIKISRLWNGLDDQYNIILLHRPRISIKVDEYIWRLIEQNIVIPKKIMQSSLYDYELVVSLQKYNPKTCRFFLASPYNGSLKENVTLSTDKNSKKFYNYEDFIGGAERTTWFSPEKFWLNGGNKTALISACAEIIDQNITPLKYAELLFDTFAATLLYNFKKLKKSEFDELKTCIEHDVVYSFPFPAPFIEQKYQGDEKYLRVTQLRNGIEEVLIDIPNIEIFYKQSYSE